MLIISEILARFPMRMTISSTESDEVVTQSPAGYKSLTENDTDEGENDELRDDQERKVSCDNGAV